MISHIPMSVKWRLPVVFIIALLCAAQNARAQEKITFGFGVSLNPSEFPGDQQSLFHTDGVADFYMPVQIGDLIRAELQVGYFTESSNQTDSNSQGAFNQHISQSFVRGGFGVFYTWHPDSVFTMYFGPRTGVLASTYYVSYSRTSKGYADGESNWAAFYIMACLGGEYAISHHFSLGGELQVQSIGYGVPVVSPTPTTYPQNYYSQVYATSAIILVRYYF
jgi:hypothetical protein